MKWYLKCLRQYADFSGRARRKEYWMFVLFYFIFAIAAGIIDAVVSNALEVRQPGNICSLTYTFAMVLPFLAVTVRRLHDTGRSGWWILVSAIPSAGFLLLYANQQRSEMYYGLLGLASLLIIAGAVWLFVYTVLDSQYGDNRYGTNPKISPQKPDEKAWTASAATTVIIAASFHLLMCIVNYINYTRYGTVGINQILNLIIPLLFLVTGIMLLQSRTYGSTEDEKRRRISVPLIIYGALISVQPVLSAFDFLRSWNSVHAVSGDVLPVEIYEFICGFPSGILGGITVLFFAVTLAMSNRKLLKTASVILAVTRCIFILNNVIFVIIISGADKSHLFHFSFFVQISNVSLILLAGLFMSRKKEAEGVTAQPQDVTATQPQPDAAQKSSTEKIYFERDNRGTRVETMQHSLAYWLGERMQSIRKDPFVYYIFTNESDARNAMLDLPFIHLAADTGKIVCDEIFRFGYFAVTSNGVFTGEYDAFVTGVDFTLDYWEITNEIFSRHNGKRKNDLKPEANIRKTSPTVDGNAKNVSFVREDRNAESIWKVYKAPCKADAVAFLSTQTITRPLYYVVVETPEGNFGRDKDGFYQE